MNNLHNDMWAIEKGFQKNFLKIDNGSSSSSLNAFTL